MSAAATARGAPQEGSAPGAPERWEECWRQVRRFDEAVLWSLAAERAPLVYWERDGERLAGLGAVRTLRASGPGRFASWREASRAVFLEGSQAQPGEAPRLLGGWAFHEAASRDALWADFAAGVFLLPELELRDGPQGARLCLRWTASTRERVWRQAEELERLLLRSTPALRPLPPTLGAAEPAAASYRARVHLAREAIAAGQFDKVVLARSEGRPLLGVLPPETLLTRLRQVPAASRFLLRLGDTAFFAASPERLVARRGSRVLSEALAGSRPAAEDGLLDSQKDRREQEFVRREVVARLEPFCRTVTAAELPELATYGDLRHLRTTIEGELKEPRHILELAEAIHPTPAVGGYPREAALRWLEAEEGLERGWYAGAVGWFDATGDGDFAVAIRSGLATPSHLTLYAGAGIVDGSDEEREWQETEWKLQVLGATVAIP